jgi:hypothetical protein
MTTDVIVRNYRLLDPLDWGEDCEAELRRMTALWNRLVEIDNGHRNNYRAETADDPTVKALKERYDTLLATVDGLIAKRKEASARARKRVPAPGLDDEIAALKADRRAIAQLSAATKEARGRAKTRLDI